MQAGSASSSRGRVLVTGSDGFTGRYLTAELASRGYSVVELTESVCDLRSPTAVLDFVQANRPNYAIHLAGITFVPHGSPVEIYEVNTIGTTNLLDALAQAKLDMAKIILASSSQVYGAVSRDGIDESCSCHPVNHYACSKLAMEHMAATYRGRLPIVITRPFNYTGPGQSERFLVPKIVGHYARRASTIELGNLEIVRDFSDVRAVVDAYCRLLDAPVVGQTLNICSGVGRPLRWLVDECARLSGHELKLVVRADLVRSGDSERLIGSNARLVAAIGALRYGDFGATLQAMLNSAEAAERAR
jgi:nucleoside-diphosphate-sugar epimerase